MIETFDLGQGWQAIWDHGFNDDPRASVEQRQHGKAETLTIWQPGHQQTAIVLGAESIERLRAIFAQAQHQAAA